MKIKHIVLKHFFLLCCSFLFITWNTSNIFAATVHKPTLSHQSMIIPIHESARLTVNRAQQPITFSSANSTIATVSKTGIITGKSEGKTTITVKTGTTSLTCTVTIYKLTTADQTTNPAIIIDNKLFYLGDSLSKITELFGRPDRIDPTIYDFDYYVFHKKNYKHFCMIGIKDNKVVSVYTDAKNFQVGNLTSDSTIPQVNQILNSSLLRDTQSNYAQAHNIHYQLFFDQVEEKNLVGILVASAPLTPTNKRTASILRAEEREMFDCCNSARVRHKLPPLVWSPLARQSSVAHCKDMIKKDYYSHISPNGQYPSDRMKKVGIHALVWGENLSADYIDGVTSHIFLYNSEMHRMNMLNPNFSHLGIGGAAGGRYHLYFAENFYKK